MHDICRGKDCMKKYLTKQIFKRAHNGDNYIKKTKLLTKEQRESYGNVKIC